MRKQLDALTPEFFRFFFFAYKSKYCILLMYEMWLTEALALV
jgi:hypothetical protein